MNHAVLNSIRASRESGGRTRGPHAKNAIKLALTEADEASQNILLHLPGVVLEECVRHQGTGRSTVFVSSSNDVRKRMPYDKLLGD